MGVELQSSNCNEEGQRLDDRLLDTSYEVSLRHEEEHHQRYHRRHRVRHLVRPDGERGGGGDTADGALLRGAEILHTRYRADGRLVFALPRCSCCFEAQRPSDIPPITTGGPPEHRMSGLKPTNGAWHVCLADPRP